MTVSRAGNCALYAGGDGDGGGGGGERLELEVRHCGVGWLGGGAVWGSFFCVCCVGFLFFFVFSLFFGLMTGGSVCGEKKKVSERASERERSVVSGE